jgi:hypothetical protein
MKKLFQTGVTTCVVGFGVWFAIIFVSGVCTLFGEGAPFLFRLLSIFAIFIGAVAALFWTLRRLRGEPVGIPEWIFLVGAFISISGLAEQLVANEARGFLAFDPRVAVQRVASSKPGDVLSLLGTTSMGVRVYSVERGGKPLWIVGICPRYSIWWVEAFDMGQEDYEKLERQGTLDKPL